MFYDSILHDQVVLRTTPGKRQEIIAKFYEDERKIKVLTIQRWNVRLGRPQEKVYMTFTGSEIRGTYEVPEQHHRHPFW
jgi:hypothetical protein